jgi:hypothetical protein
MNFLVRNFTSLAASLRCPKSCGPSALLPVLTVSTFTNICDGFRLFHSSSPVLMGKGDLKTKKAAAKRLLRIGGRK